MQGTRAFPSPRTLRSAPLRLSPPPGRRSRDVVPAIELAQARHREQPALKRGRELKVAVEFDDEAVGLKQLLAAYAALERDGE